MKNSRIASIVAGLAILAFTAASCDIFDPWDPGNGGGNGGGGNGGGGNGGGGNDTIIWDDPLDSNWNPRDTSGNNDNGGGQDQNVMVRGEGTIVWVEIEGGFWGIEATNGHEYEPLNLDPQFMKNGLKVRFSGKLEQNVSFHQWGEVLSVGNMSTI